MKLGMELCIKVWGRILTARALEGIDLKRADPLERVAMFTVPSFSVGVCAVSGGSL
jgi:hypothetical protein